MSFNHFLNESMFINRDKLCIILMIRCNFFFVILINKISKAQKKITSIGLRLNPNIKAQTHKKISTGIEPCANIEKITKKQKFKIFDY